MITIRKDNTIKTVTRGAYESFYKPLGYTVERSVKKEPVKVQEVKEEKKEIKATKPMKQKKQKKESRCSHAICY